tara:strand:- start:333 stop:1634 length:1302 start_codon:yes stop_codon:yes gene_type:complete
MMNRRSFISDGSKLGLGTALMAGNPSALLSNPHDVIYPKGKAEHCIMLWLAGGVSQADTWDPKRLGDPDKRVTGSAYPAINTAIPGVKVCEHLPKTAAMLDRFMLVRTVNHKIVDEHSAATNFMHTGRPTQGTIIYPSIGSIVANQRGNLADGIPPYVVIGYPSIQRGPGFLGSKSGFVYLTDTEAGPAGLTRPSYINSARQRDREQLLNHLRKRFRVKHPNDKKIADYDAAVSESFALTKGDFMSAFELKNESSTLRESYGDEFGQRCLLSRRLVQRGVRFIEVSFNLNFINGTGWDTHRDGQKNQHILIRQLDQALTALVTDLEKHRLLDKTLIVVASEFGRPPEFDSGGGRGHWSKSFSVAMAGGGLKTGQAIGESDELGKQVVSEPVSVPDLHATIHCALGINPGKYLHDGSRPVPITDRGKPIAKLFS